MASNKRLGKASPGLGSANTTTAEASSKKVVVKCPICDNIIRETVGKRLGQDAIECNGSCATWLHRHCAGLTREAYLAASNTDTPFYCPQCRLDQQELDIKSLRDLVTKLSSQLSVACEEIACLKRSSLSEPESVNSSNGDQGTRSVDGPSVIVNTGASGSRSYAQVARGSLQQESSFFTSSKSHDRKSNLVLFGVDECDTGTSWLQRSMNDIGNVTSILTGLDQSIHNSSVLECKRLGKFKPDSTNSRPILARMARPVDVMCVLSNKNKLTGPIFIKPDLTREERNIEKLLLKERWTLIQSGISRRDIRIRQSALFVKGELHAMVTDNALELQHSVDTEHACVSPSHDHAVQDAEVLGAPISSSVEAAEDSPSALNSVSNSSYSNCSPTLSPPCSSSAEAAEGSPSALSFTSNCTQTLSSPCSLTEASNSVPLESTSS